MASLSDKAGFLIGANLVKYAVGFCMPMVMVRLISQQDYGTYQQLLLVNNIALGLLTFGLPTSIYYFYGRGDAVRRRALTLQTVVMLAFCGTFATATLATVAPLIAERVRNPDVQALLPLYAVAVGLMLASEHFTCFMIARNHYGTAVTFETVETVVRVLTLVTPVILGFGLFGLVVSAALYASIRFVVRTVWLFRTSEEPPLGDRSELFPKEQLAYSLPLALGSVVAVFGGLLDRAIVAGSFSTVEYAIYTVGALEIPIDAIFQASVANVLRAALPALVKNEQMDEIVRLLHEAVRKLALIVLPTFVFLLGHSQEFITLMFTDKYVQSTHVFRIYLFLVPLHMFVLSPVPQAFGKTKINLQIVVVFTLCNLLLSFLLIKWVGFYGPAIALVSSCYVTTLIYFIVVKRLTGATTLRLLPLNSMLRTVACALGGLAASWAVGDVLTSRLGNFLLQALIFSVVYFALAVAARLFTEQDRRLAKRWAAKVRLA